MHQIIKLGRRKPALALYTAGSRDSGDATKALGSQEPSALFVLGQLHPISSSKHTAAVHVSVPENDSDRLHWGLLHTCLRIRGRYSDRKFYPTEEVNSWKTESLYDNVLILLF